MSRTARALLLFAAVSASLVACQRREEPAEPAAAPAPSTPAASGAAPMAYDSKTPYATVKLTLPPSVRDKPDLHAPLYAAAVRDLKQFSEGAQGDLSEAGGGITSSGSVDRIRWRISLSAAWFGAMAARGERLRVASLKESSLSLALRAASSGPWHG